jgi:hypothetical protein
MTARRATRSPQGQDERNRMMVDSIDPTIELLGMVKPDVSVVAPHRHKLLPRGRGESISSTGWSDPPARAWLRYPGQSYARWNLLEPDLGKPVISSASAMTWHALRLAGVGQLIPGYGCLLS